MNLATRLLRSVALHGARLVVEDDQLVLYGEIPPTLKGALKENKHDLLVLLADDLDDLPLAAKLRAYGEPFPLMVNGRVAAWLVPDAEAKVEKDEPVYTAAEVERMTEREKA